METIPVTTCQMCGESYVRRTVHPVRCPRCGRKIDYDAGVSPTKVQAPATSPKRGDQIVSSCR